MPRHKVYDDLDNPYKPYGPSTMEEDNEIDGEPIHSDCVICGHSFEEHGGVYGHISATKCYRCKCDHFDEGD